MLWVSFIPPRSRRLVLRAAQYEHLPVLITGQTGAGKSRVAQWIHLNGPRSTKPYVVLDPRRDLAEQLAQAGSGTIVFEDFHLWDASFLTSLSSLVRTRSFVSQGVRHIVHARVIVTQLEGFDSASPLWEPFEPFHLPLPSLVERLEEFEDIVHSFLRESLFHPVSGEPKMHIKGLDRLAWAKLKAHSWPGNLRELRDVIRHAVNAAQGSWILSEDLPELRLSNGLRAEMRSGEDKASNEAVKASRQNPGPSLS